MFLANAKLNRTVKSDLTLTVLWQFLLIPHYVEDGLTHIHMFSPVVLIGSKGQWFFVERIPGCRLKIEIHKFALRFCYTTLQVLTPRLTKKYYGIIRAIKTPFFFSPANLWRQIYPDIQPCSSRLAASRPGKHNPVIQSSSLLPAP